MAIAVTVARWSVSAADNGVGPTTIADDSGNGNVLAVHYGSSGANWSTIPAGRGFTITAAANTAGGPRLYITDAEAVGIISAALAGALEASLLLKIDVNTPAATVTLYRIANQASGSACFAVFMDAARQIIVVWGDEYGTYRSASFVAIPTGVCVLAIRINTALVAGDDRIKLAANGSPVALQAGGSDVTLNLAFGVTEGYPVSVNIFNNGAGNNNPQGTLYNAELFTGYLTDTQVVDSAEALIANNDADWTLSSSGLAGAAAGQATATGALQGPGLEFTLRDIDSGTVKNAVTYARVDVHLASDLSLVKTFTNITTSPAGLMQLSDSLLQTLGVNYFVVGWTSSGSDRFHANATVAGLS